jgi:hypothetical protein
MNKIAKGIAALVAGITLGGAVLAASGGSYSSTAVGPTIYSANYWYVTNFPIVGSTPPSDAAVYLVPWSYTVGTIPAGTTFVAQLCHGSRCLDVSNSRSGNTSFFEGESAAVPFHLQYRINKSSGTIPPVSGGSAQVIVNWTH